MQIIMTSKEFDEAVSLWLQDQGFNTDTHSISTRVIAGRTDSGAGTRVEVTLEPTPVQIPSGPIPREVSLLEELVPDTFPTTRRFGQGHADE